jgi:hypothetical protein
MAPFLHLPAQFQMPVGLQQPSSIPHHMQAGSQLHQLQSHQAQASALSLFGLQFPPPQAHFNAGALPQPAQTLLQAPSTFQQQVQHALQQQQQQVMLSAMPQAAPPHCMLLRPYMQAALTLVHLQYLQC